MAKYEVTKSVEGVKVSKRSGIPTTERITVSFGAIIEDPREERDCLRFSHLGELVDVKLAEIHGYYKPIDGSAPAPAAAATASAPARPADTRFIKWEPIPSNVPTQRAKVPGGWLVTVASGVAFVPDTGHNWDGSSL
jgi:hypothetical protein